MKNLPKILLGCVAVAALAVATPAEAYDHHHHGTYVYHRGHYGYYYGTRFTRIMRGRTRTIMGRTADQASWWQGPDRRWSWRHGGTGFSFSSRNALCASRDLKGQLVDDLELAH